MAETDTETLGSAVQGPEPLYSSAWRNRGKCALACGLRDCYPPDRNDGPFHHACIMPFNHPGACAFDPGCGRNPPDSPLNYKPEFHRRVRPEDVWFTPQALDPNNPTNVLRRIARQVQGIALPEPRIVDDAAKWAYWFSEHGRLRRNVDDDRDNFLVIRGAPGCGKSTLALRVASSMYPEIDASNVKDHFAFSVAQFHQLVLKSSDTFLALDEAAVGGLSIDWNRPEARALVETAQTMRYRHLTVALLIPHVDDLLSSLRVRRAEWHIKCNHDPKGTAVVREKNWDLDLPLSHGDLGLRTRWDWNPIHWEAFPDDNPLWVEYLNLKTRADDRRTRSQFVELRTRERAHRMVTDRASKASLTTAQAARFLRVSDDTVKRLSNAGQLEAHRLPSGLRRFDLDDLVRFESTYLRKSRKSRNSRRPGRGRHEGRKP